jgi:hypothetical protein
MELFGFKKNWILKKKWGASVDSLEAGGAERMAVNYTNALSEGSFPVRFGD